MPEGQPASSTVAYYATVSSVWLALAAFALGFALDRKRKLDSGLDVHLARASAGGAIPTALVLIYCAFDPATLSQLTGLNVPIAAAGLALLYVSIKGVMK